MTLEAAGAPVTQLSEDERLFADAVRAFAHDEVAPLVRRMDEEQHMDAALVREDVCAGADGH